ncbi:MAG TPA: hypothetical protein VGM82_17195 [Gemmatimonadaceae bacterium]
MKHSAASRTVGSKVRGMFAGVAVATALFTTERLASGAEVRDPATRTPSAPPWRVGTEEHVDLWLHGFSLLTSDTGKVTFFARGYRQQMMALKKQRGVTTNLDVNMQKLQQRFSMSPALANAQFVAMYFSSLQELSTAMDLFVRAGGEPRRASDPMQQQEIALLAQNFPSPADREWARLFMQSLQDESNKFYHAYWLGEQQARATGFSQFNQQWVGTWYPKLSRYLNNTQQSAGEIILSLPLGGEGRTVNGGKTQNSIAVSYPKTGDAAPEALFGFAHEAVAKLVDEAVNDNTTPAEQRSGATAGYTGNGAVRGGALLIEKTSPELAQAYMRYYVSQTGATPPIGDPRAAFEAAFPLPAAIVTAVGKAIDSVLAGI